MYVEYKTKKQTKQKHTTKYGLVVTKGKGWREGKMGKGVKYLMTDGNYIFGGEHTILYADIELLSCIPETYTML